MRLCSDSTERLIASAATARKIGSLHIASIMEELIDRRAAEEINLLERGMAYDHAASTIDSNCTPALADEDSDEFADWFDLRDANAQEAVDEAVRYLESRGLLEHHASDSNIVCIRDESEALR